RRPVAVEWRNGVLPAIGMVRPWASRKRRASRASSLLSAIDSRSSIEAARRIESHTISGPAGRLEALLEEPEDGPPRMAAVLCHPHPLYGGTMHNKVVYRMARGLRRTGIAVTRFNFRGVGASEGEHAHLEGEIEDARAVLAWLRDRYPALP